MMNWFVLHVLENEGESVTMSSARDTPAQKRVREDISTLNSQVAAMVQIRSTGLNLEVDANAIKKKKKEITNNETKLKR